MRLVSKEFMTNSRTTEYELFTLGDVHMGAPNCAEDKLKRIVRRIADTPNAYWFGGGDILDAVILQDEKRFDPNTLPDWMLSKGPEHTRRGLSNMLTAQRDRFFRITEPIGDKCLGLIEGNHEYAMMKHHNRDILREMCEHFGTDNLTDCAFVRLQFGRKRGDEDRGGPNVRVFICHGHGGGRSSGAELNILYNLAADKDVDIVLKGHSHTYAIHAPIPMLTIPSKGKMPADPVVYEKYAANWGAYLYTYASGPSTYASRANYPVRPMYTVQAVIRPHVCTKHGLELPSIALNPIRL